MGRQKATWSTENQKMDLIMPVQQKINAYFDSTTAANRFMGMNGWEKILGNPFTADIVSLLVTVTLVMQCSVFMAPSPCIIHNFICKLLQTVLGPDFCCLFEVTMTKQGHI